MELKLPKIVKQSRNCIKLHDLKNKTQADLGNSPQVQALSPLKNPLTPSEFQKVFEKANKDEEAKFADLLENLNFFMATA